MIKLLTDLPDGVLGIEAVGHVEADDYANVVEPAVRAALEHSDKVRLLYVLGDKHWLWGFVDAGLVVLFALAGKSLLEGRSFGRWVAIVAASIGCLRWFYWMPFAPFLALTMVAMLFLVLYAVLVTWE
jgi:hypothetical protein